jgi:hypothetical protein
MLAVLPIILGAQFLLQAVTADVQNVPAHPLQGDPPAWNASWSVEAGPATMESEADVPAADGSGPQRQAA